jgi:hypothetical protein
METHWYSCVLLNASSPSILCTYLPSCASPGFIIIQGPMLYHLRPRVGLGQGYVIQGKGDN